MAWQLDQQRKNPGQTMTGVSWMADVINLPYAADGRNRRIALSNLCRAIPSFLEVARTE